MGRSFVKCRRFLGIAAATAISTGSVLQTVTTTETRADGLAEDERLPDALGDMGLGELREDYRRRLLRFRRARACPGTGLRREDDVDPVRGPDCLFDHLGIHGPGVGQGVVRPRPAPSR